LNDRNIVLSPDFAITHGNIEAGMKGIMKYDYCEPKYDLIAYNKAVDNLYQSYMSIGKCDVVYDYDTEFVNSTSAGYPANFLFQDKGKARSDHEWMMYVDRFVASETYIPALASNTVKAYEPKKIEKIEANDLRVICALSMENTALGNFLFAEMNSLIHEAGKRGIIGSAVGMTKFHLGWQELFYRLDRFPNAIDFDFHKYDGTIDSKNIEMCMNVRINMYKRLDASTINRVRHFYQHVQFTLIVAENGDVILKMLGNPSGQKNTITDNGMVNEFRWLYAWELLCPKEYSGKFREHCEFVYMGDDVLGTVSDEAAAFYHPQAIYNVFLPMGWVKKEGDTMHKFKKLEDCTFCSSKFYRTVGGKIVPAPASREKTLVSLAYGAKRASRSYAILRACAIRVDCYYDRYLFDLITDYIDYMIARYRPILEMSIDIPFSEIMSNYHPEIFIADLYLNPE
jgi:hypothetical protein